MDSTVFPGEDGAVPFWLEVQDPDDQELEFIRVRFNLHPLAIEDCRQKNQRPKLDDYQGYFFMVIFALQGSVLEAARVPLGEYHLFVGKSGMITVHWGESPEFAANLKRLGDPTFPFPSTVHHLFYFLTEPLVDSFFPFLEEMDDHLDLLQDKIVARANPEVLQELFKLKQVLVRLRKVLSPQRDLFLSLASPIHAGVQADVLPYMRDLHDHLSRAYELVDSYRDLLTGAMDVYLSTVSNRLNDVMKRLTIVATVFMPLSFITGFFGMNFGYLTRHLISPEAFWAGLTLMLLSLLGMYWWFKVKGWLG